MTIGFEQAATAFLDASDKANMPGLPRWVRAEWGKSMEALRTRMNGTYSGMTPEARRAATEWLRDEIAARRERERALECPEFAPDYMREVRR